jgi:uncharacterized protein (TIGR04551 family)
MRALVLSAAVLAIVAARADAQPTPPPAKDGKDTKDAPVVEPAKPPGLLPTTPALPAGKARRHRWKLFDLDGYFRVRTEWDKNFNLGFNDNPALGGAPFPRATSCHATMVLNHPCSDTLDSTNMRLRLEPTFHIDENASVHAQVDVLDNLVLGSTPIGTDYSGIYNTTTTRPPFAGLGSTQGSVIQGVNSDRPSIEVKRAWAEVALPLDGILKAGRMPDHWGLGMFHNAGGYDPINGTYNYDADYGDSVDRVSLSVLVPGTQLRVMGAIDWDVTRLVSNQTSSNRGQEGHPLALDNPSKATGYVGVISKMEPLQEFNAAVDRGETMLDYGLYFEYKTQSWDQDPTGFTLGGTFDANNHYVPRDLKTYTPDLWGRLGFGSFLLEGEVVAQLGSVHHLDDLGIVGKEKIAKLGAVARFTWKGVDGKLKLGIEGGFASGDQWDNTPQGATNIAFANQLGDPAICNPGHECTLSQFIFNRDYHIDLIFWRRLVTAVTNAEYMRPFLQYDLGKSFSFKVWNVTSFAHKPVATPGNDILYGTEFDADISFTSGRLRAGIAGGVFFPFAALSHPADDMANQGGPGFGYGIDAVTMQPNTGDPGSAYTVQTRLVLVF